MGRAHSEDHRSRGLRRWRLAGLGATIKVGDASAIRWAVLKAATLKRQLTAPASRRHSALKS